jgi:hypothetical protein
MLSPLFYHCPATIPCKHLALVDPSGAQIAAKTYLLTTAQGDSITASAQAMGWYTFTVRSFNTPAGNQKPSYKLTATYTAPQVLT